MISHYSCISIRTSFEQYCERVSINKCPIITLPRVKIHILLCRNNVIKITDLTNFQLTTTGDHSINIFSIQKKFDPFGNRRLLMFSDATVVIKKTRVMPTLMWKVQHTVLEPMTKMLLLLLSFYAIRASLKIRKHIFLWGLNCWCYS